MLNASWLAPHRLNRKKYAMTNFDLQFRINIYRPLCDGARHQAAFQDGLNVLVLDDLDQVAEALASLKREFENAWEIARETDEDVRAEEMSARVFFSLLTEGLRTQQLDERSVNETEELLSALAANIDGKDAKRWDIPLVAGRGCGGLSGHQWLALVLAMTSRPGQIILIVDEPELRITELFLSSNDAEYVVLRLAPMVH